MNHFVFDALFVIVPIFIFGIFVLVIATMISPKLRGKMMGRQIKAAKYMMNEIKDDLVEMGTTAENVKVNVEKNMMDQNEEILRDLTKRKANIDKEAIEIKVRAMKDGFTKDKMFCKYCGASIDEDSKFCKKCGKQQ